MSGDKFFICIKANVINKTPSELSRRFNSFANQGKKAIILPHLYGYTCDLDEIKMESCPDLPEGGPGMGTSLLMINNELHIIFGAGSKYHYKYNIIYLISAYTL